MKLALIHNPRSGYNRRHPGAVTAAAAEAGVPVWEVPCLGTGLVPALREIAATAPDALLVNGGDGTVDAVVTAMRTAVDFSAEPALAVLAGGSTNMIARDVGCRGRPEAALRRLACATDAALETVSRAPMVITDAGGGPARLGFFLGGGALPAVLRRTQQRANGRGFVGLGDEVLTLARTTLRLLAGDLRKDPMMAPRPVRWSVPGSPGGDGSGELVLHLVTTLDRLVLGIRPGQTQPSLRFLGVKYPYRNIVVSIARILGGRPFDRLDGNFVFRSGSRLRLEGDADVVIDGEPLALGPQPGALDLSLGAPLRFLRVPDC